MPATVQAPSSSTPSVASTPASTPAAAPATAKPTTATSPTTPAAFESGASEIDRMFGEGNVAAKPDAAKPAEVKLAAEAKPADAQPAAPASDKPATPQADVNAPTTGIKELRAAFEAQKKEASRLKSELETLRKAAPKAPEGEDDPKALREKLIAESKRREDTEKELRFANYERSPEYKEKYQAPLENALTAAYTDVKAMGVIGEDGSITRKATEEDFVRLLTMDAANAAASAKAWFGDASQVVVNHWFKIMDLNRERKLAKDRYDKESVERDQRSTLEQQAARDQELGLWQQTISKQVEDYPQFFAPVEGDEEGNQLLEKGFNVADIAFSGQPLPVEQKVNLFATLRNKAAGFDRLALLYKRANDKVVELEKQLEGFKASTPGTSDGVSVVVSDHKQHWEDELMEMARK